MNKNDANNDIKNDANSSKNDVNSSKNGAGVPRQNVRDSKKKRIIFSSYPDFSDNPRGLFEAIKDNPNYESRWIVQDATLTKPLEKAGIASVIKDTPEADDALAAADIVVSSSFDFSEKKRDGQLYLSTWHGFPLKTIGFLEEQASSLDGLLMQKFLYTKYDMVLAPSKIAQLFLGGMFAMDPRKFRVTGYPRNDILLTSPGRQILHDLFPEIPSSAKLLFYLPTMRKGLKKEGAQFDDNLFNWPSFDAQKLEDTLAKHDIYIVVKPHFADNKLVDLKRQNLSHIKVIETETLTEKLLTIYHILSGFDGLITDYSSIYTDFLLLDKPIFFNCPDLELYQAQRGFVTEDPRLLMPGELVKTQEAFSAALEAFAGGKDAFREKRHEVLPIFQHFRDTKSGERTIAALEEYTADERFDADKYVANYFVGHHAPLASYANKMRAELFCSPNAFFSTEEVQTQTYRLAAETNEPKRIELTFEIPRETRFVRFDPDDDGIAVVSHLKASIADVELQPIATNGEIVDGKYVFGLPDPQIVLKIPEGLAPSDTASKELSSPVPSAGQPCQGEQTMTLRVSFEAQNYFISGLQQQLQESIQAQKRELAEIKASKSWRLITRLRHLLRRR